MMEVQEPCTSSSVLFTDVIEHKPLPSVPIPGQLNRFRLRKWVWTMSILDILISFAACGRFFYYVSYDARISNSPPDSELEDRISLLWIWFSFLAAYTCQILFAAGLIITTRFNDWITALGNCQLYLNGAHFLNTYTAIELCGVCYYVINKSKSLSPTNLYLLPICAVAKATFRSGMFCTVKCFMRDLNRRVCNCKRRARTIPSDNDIVFLSGVEENPLPRRSWNL